MSENIAEAPRMKAAVSIMDPLTVEDELREFVQINDRIDLYIVTDPNLIVLSFLIDGERRDEEVLVPLFQMYFDSIEENQKLTDVWFINKNLYQIAVSIIKSGPKIHGLLILGDRVDDELALNLKYMTNSDVSFIVNEFVLGSTIENFERILLLEAVDAADRITPGGMNSGPEQFINTFDLDDAVHLYIKGNFPGYPQANYFLSQSNDSETTLLGELRLIFILVGISAVAVVFLFSFLWLGT